MTRTGELILIAISISMFITLIISQTIWTRGHDNPYPLQNAQVVLGNTDGLIPANYIPVKLPADRRRLPSLN